ncbi:MAG TPA: Yip1 family protein [Syntrophomonadaceae bacterium]|nr:Yip1 family protein [Syntrophomonadaceae bacterium]HNX28152.1 Yip1 family protein [Syntrophomonadaceae bacterium]HPR93445.1 Yip1 family protein [Syntrophomonadaceae bacterium]
MSFTDRLWNTIFNPDLAMRQLTAEKPLGQSLVLYIAVLTFIMIINQGVVALRPIEEALSLPAQYIWLLVCTGIILSLLGLFLGAGFLSLLSEIIYSRGNNMGLLVGLCFAVLPGLFGAVLQYVSMIIGLNWLGGTFSFISIIWVIVLQIIAVRAAFDLSTGQALIIYFSPFFILALTAIIFTGFILVSSLSLL